MKSYNLDLCSKDVCNGITLTAYSSSLVKVIYSKLGSRLVRPYIYLDGRSICFFEKEDNLHLVIHACYVN